MPSIGQTWVLASIGAVVEMGILSTLNRLLMESKLITFGLVFGFDADFGEDMPNGVVSSRRKFW
jgi:hypothetical protein